MNLSLFSITRRRWAVILGILCFITGFMITMQQRNPENYNLFQQLYCFIAFNYLYVLLINGIQYSSSFATLRYKKIRAAKKHIFSELNKSAVLYLFIYYAFCIIISKLSGQRIAFRYLPFIGVTAFLNFILVNYFYAIYLPIGRKSFAYSVQFAYLVFGTFVRLTQVDNTNIILSVYAYPSLSVTNLSPVLLQLLLNYGVLAYIYYLCAIRIRKEVVS